MGGLTLKQKASERATRIKNLGIATAKENAGMVRDIVDMVFDYKAKGLTYSEAIEATKDDLEKLAVERYTPRITAALRRAGLEVPDDFKATPQAIQDLLSEQTGLDIENLTGDGVSDAIDGLLSKRLSESLGVQIDSVLSVDGLKEAMRAGVAKAIENGTAEKLITAGLTKAARKYATWKARGVTKKSEQKAIMHGWSQKKYARTHRQVWR